MGEIYKTVRRKIGKFFFKGWVAESVKVLHRICIIRFIKHDDMQF